MAKNLIFRTLIIQVKRYLAPLHLIVTPILKKAGFRAIMAKLEPNMLPGLFVKILTS